MRIAKLLVVAVLAAAVAAPAMAQSRLQEILKRGSIRVGTTGDFNPMSIRDPASNSFKGYEIDAARDLAKELGVKLELVPTDWPTLVAGITANRYDIFMGGSSINSARAKTIAYTIPYIETGTVPVFQKSAAAKFASWDDINKKGVTVAVVLGTVFEQQAKQHFPNATIKAVQPPASGFQEVLAGRADVTITSSIDAQGIVARYAALGHMPVAAARNKRPFGYIVAQGDPTWVNFLNTWIYLKKSEGFFAALE
ncbi:MAG: transporter substrate-binding domain-containing protein, partial [Rhodospirillaceae bacterium]|nr:transporter substrate-binding domain-containing protein [Rhodospirillaceae bacterium]